MKLRHSAEKLDEYRQRFDKGKAAKITPDHVVKIIDKLTAKKKKVAEVRNDAKKNSKKRDRLTTKLALIDEQIARARWLKKKIENSSR